MDFLAQGRFGKVYRLNSTQVVKTIGATSMWIAMMELGVLSTLPPHPNIVKYQGLLRPGVCFEFVLADAGRSLTDIMNEMLANGDFWDSTPEYSIRYVYHLMQQAAEGLHHLHRHLIAHRDLTSNNVAVDSAGHVTIIDFGLACSAACRFELDKDHRDRRCFCGVGPCSNECNPQIADVFMLGRVAMDCMDFVLSPKDILSDKDVELLARTSAWIQEMLSFRRSAAECCRFFSSGKWREPQSQQSPSIETSRGMCCTLELNVAQLCTAYAECSSDRDIFLASLDRVGYLNEEVLHAVFSLVERTLDCEPILLKDEFEQNLAQVISGAFVFKPVKFYRGLNILEQ